MKYYVEVVISRDHLGQLTDNIVYISPRTLIIKANSKEDAIEKIKDYIDLTEYEYKIINIAPFNKYIREDQIEETNLDNTRPFY